MIWIIASVVILLGLMALELYCYLQVVGRSIDRALTPTMASCPWVQRSDQAVCKLCGQVTDMNHQEETECPYG